MRSGSRSLTGCTHRGVHALGQGERGDAGSSRRSCTTGAATLPRLRAGAARRTGARRARSRAAWRERRGTAIAIALLSPLSYILVLTAMVFTPVSLVAPAREVSILFAALMGAHLLREGDVDAPRSSPRSAWCSASRGWRWGRIRPNRGAPRMPPFTTCPPGRPSSRTATRSPPRAFAQLWSADPGRGEALTFACAGIAVDFSKQRITAETLGLLARARARTRAARGRSSGSSPARR